MGNARSGRVRSVQDSQTWRLRPGRYRWSETASNRGELRRLGQALQVVGEMSKGRYMQRTRVRQEKRGGPKMNNNKYNSQGASRVW